jgi:hypothetical protein
LFPELSANACREQFEPYRERITAAINAGVKRFNEIQPAETLYVLAKRKRSRRTAIWACIMYEIETTLAEVPGLKLVAKFETIELYFGENMVGRIKAMDPKGFTSNYQTPRVKAFHTERGRRGRTYASEDQGELFAVMWSAPMRIDIGYLDDELGVAVAKIMLARRRTPRIMAFVIEVTDEPLVIPIPATAAPELPAASEASESSEAPVTGEIETRIVPRPSQRPTEA